MVKAGHMDALDEIFRERRERGEAGPCFVLEESMIKNPKEDMWELAAGVALGMVCIVIFTFFVAVL